VIRFASSDVFLVTGASSGIGSEVALLLNRLGGTVVAVARDGARLEGIRSTAESPERFLVEPRDLARTDDLDEWLSHVTGRRGALRGLVHAAGTLGPSPLRVLSLEGTRKVFDLNVLAAWALTKAFFRPENTQGRGCAAVLISSVSSYRGLSGSVSYSASKGAVDALVRSLAREGAEIGLRFNAVLPGMVKTPMTKGVPLDQVEYLLGQQFLEGWIEPSDVACLCAFLLADCSRFVTGECVSVDGGSGIRMQGPYGANAPGAAG
jgi:NAD(P)-dependent dehydrogenase (short-subunit alcohol dehydrogenase family)